MFALEMQLESDLKVSIVQTKLDYLVGPQPSFLRHGPTFLPKGKTNQAGALR